MSFGGQLDGPRPYHSIDLESSPGALNRGPSNDNEERMPLSPRVSAAPQLHIQEVSDEPKGAYPPRPDFNQMPSHSSTTRNGHKSSSSWDVLGGIQKDWNGFDSRNGSQAAFQYAQGLSWPSHLSLNIFLLLTSLYMQATHQKQRYLYFFPLSNILKRVSPTRYRLESCISIS